MGLCGPKRAQVFRAMAAAATARQAAAAAAAGRGGDENNARERCAPGSAWAAHGVDTNAGGAGGEQKEQHEGHLSRKSSLQPRS